MQRRGLKIPLLIVVPPPAVPTLQLKFQHYEPPVIQVADASLVVNVCNDVLHPEN